MFSLYDTWELIIVSIFFLTKVDKHILPEVKDISLGIYTSHTDLQWPSLTPIEPQWPPT